MTSLLIAWCIILPIFQASPAFLQNNVPTGPPTAPPAAEDTELAMAISASLQTAMPERPPFPDTQTNFDASSSSSAVNTGNHGFLGTPNSNTSDSELVQEANPVNASPNGEHLQSHVNGSGLDFNPSAPPISNDIPTDGPIQYPSIDLSPIDMASSDVERLPNVEGKTGSGSGSSCVICLDAPAEGACIPCGHVAGCMSCLNEVKSKKWGCPVCRAKIDQIIKLYHVWDLNASSTYLFKNENFLIEMRQKNVYTRRSPSPTWGLLWIG